MRIITVTYFDTDHSIICQKRHQISHSVDEPADALGFCDTLAEGQYLMINAGFGRPMIFDDQGTRL